VVGVAIAAIATLLQRTRYRKLAGLASIGSLVGMAFIVVGLLTIQEFVGLRASVNRAHGRRDGRPSQR
jgi:hypothetical protein